MQSATEKARLFLNKYPTDASLRVVTRRLRLCALMSGLALLLSIIGAQVIFSMDNPGAALRNFTVVLSFIAMLGLLGGFGFALRADFYAPLPAENLEEALVMVDSSSAVQAIRDAVVSSGRELTYYEFQLMRAINSVSKREARKEALYRVPADFPVK